MKLGLYIPFKDGPNGETYVVFRPYWFFTYAKSIPSSNAYPRGKGN